MSDDDNIVFDGVNDNDDDVTEIMVGGTKATDDFVDVASSNRIIIIPTIPILLVVGEGWECVMNLHRSCRC